jgi:hypothetical protein
MKKMRAKKMQRGGAPTLYKIFIGYSDKGENEGDEGQEVITFILKDDNPVNIEGNYRNKTAFNDHLQNHSNRFLAAYIKINDPKINGDSIIRSIIDKMLDQIQPFDPKIAYKPSFELVEFRINDESMSGQILYVSTGSEEVKFTNLTSSQIGHGYIPFIRGFDVFILKIETGEEKKMQITPVEIGIELPHVKESDVLFYKMDANRRLNNRDAEAAKAAELERQRIEQEESDAYQRQQIEESRARIDANKKACKDEMRTEYNKIKNQLLTTIIEQNDHTNYEYKLDKTRRNKLDRFSQKPFIRTLMEYRENNFNHNRYTCGIPDDKEWFDQFLEEDLQRIRDGYLSSY